MAKLRLEIVTAERQVYAADVDMVVAPGIDGQLGILPRHAPLMTALNYGELIIRNEGEEVLLAIGGGFLEVLNNKVVVLADSAERAEEIDLARAEAAKQRALDRLTQQRGEGLDEAGAEAALARALIRLRVAQRRRRAPQHRA